MESREGGISGIRRSLNSSAHLCLVLRRSSQGVCYMSIMSRMVKFGGFIFLSKSNNGSKVWKILVGGIPVQSRRLNYIYMSVKQFSCKGQK